MAQITFKGKNIHTSGSLPEIGSKAPDFTLVANDLTEVTLDMYKGKQVVLNIFPSIDTGVCAASVRQFNKLAADFDNTEVLCVSRDLPFAQARFCGAEGIENVVTLSDFNTADFGKNYGLLMEDGPLKGLHSRVVIVLNTDGNIVYTEQVPDIAQEPNYDEVLKVL
ncbi:MAG: thiol peroxidase [Bacteroidales bacterium]